VDCGSHLITVIDTETCELASHGVIEREVTGPEECGENEVLLFRRKVTLRLSNVTAYFI